LPNQIPSIWLAHTIALNRHQKFDGSGYPSGLAGKAIPHSALIVAVADVFDALTSPRPYKQTWPVEEAAAFIRDNTGSHFDPKVAEHFHQSLPEILAIRDRHSEPKHEHVNGGISK
jgi:putative two-component system response regulator